MIGKGVLTAAMALAVTMRNPFEDGPMASYKIPSKYAPPQHPTRPNKKAKRRLKDKQAHKSRMAQRKKR